MSSNSDKTNSLSDRVSLKAGRVRSNILGRRVINIARATISCGPRIKIDEVMIPLIVAKSIFFPETFKPYNRERLMTYFLNGSKNYPGSWILKKKSDGIKWNCDVLKEKKYVPENGDVIYRNVITGDIVMFNRMPTLTYSSMSAHRVVVNLKEPNSYTLRMNTISTILYNADFDGDAMQIIFAVLLMS